MLVRVACHNATLPVISGHPKHAVHLLLPTRHGHYSYYHVPRYYYHLTASLPNAQVLNKL